MHLTEAQIRDLLAMIAATRERELTCDQCLEELARYVEAELAGREGAEAYRAVREHLALCGECVEERDTLLAAVRALAEE